MIGSAPPYVPLFDQDVPGVIRLGSCDQETFQTGRDSLEGCNLLFCYIATLLGKYRGSDSCHFSKGELDEFQYLLAEP
jgi:hypothetical protein